MKGFLLDQGLPRSTVTYLRSANYHSIHVGELGMSKATDWEILQIGRREDLVVVTLDADFHLICAKELLLKPSVIRIRIEGLRGETAARTILEAWSTFSLELEQGALVTVTTNSIRLRKLPLK